MRHCFRAVHLLAAIILTPAAFAQTTPADSAIKGAVYDIGRAEQQLKSLTPSRKANIKRLQRSMQMTGQRLDSSSNKSHASWTEAKQRLDAVNNALATLAGGGAAPTSSPPAAAATQSAPKATPTAPKVTQPPVAAADPAIGRAQREMKLVEAQVRNLRPSDSRGALRQLKELFRIGGYLSKVKDRSQPAFKQAAQQYGGIKQTLVNHMVKIEQNRLVNLAGKLDKMRPVDYANAGKVQSGRKALVDIDKNLKALGAAKDPGVQGVAGRLHKIADIYEQRIAKHNAQQAELGDVSGKLAALQQRFHKIRVPGRIVHPATKETVRGFIASVNAVKKHIAEDNAYIKSIDGKATLNVKDGNSFRSLRAGLQGSKPQELRRVMDTVNAEMDLNVDQALSTAKFYIETDPNDVNHRNNRLTGEGKYDEGLKTLAAAKQTVNLAVLYDKESGRANPPNRQPQIEQVDVATKSFKEKFIVALNGVRMPEARSKDDKLHDAVASVFATKKYGYAFERVVINAPLKRVKQKTGNIRGTVKSATVTVYEYEWDQFQATTAEKVGDKYYLFANSFKYYYSGDPQTQIKTWILTQRFKSSQILKENINE